MFKTNSVYEAGHKLGASRAKNVATKQIRKSFDVRKKDIEGSSPNERFNSVLELASAKLKKLKKKLKRTKVKLKEFVPQ